MGYGKIEMSNTVCSCQLSSPVLNLLVEMPAHCVIVRIFYIFGIFSKRGKTTNLRISQV